MNLKYEFEIKVREDPTPGRDSIGISKALKRNHEDN
jgi:hypothetical protein